MPATADKKSSEPASFRPEPEPEPEPSQLGPCPRLRVAKSHLTRAVAQHVEQAQARAQARTHPRPHPHLHPPAQAHAQTRMSLSSAPTSILKYQEIVPHVYLGGQRAARDIRQLERDGITHILSVMEKPPRAIGSFMRTFVPLRDDPSADLLSLLDELVAYIHHVVDGHPHPTITHLQTLAPFTKTTTTHSHPRYGSDSGSKTHLNIPLKQPQHRSIPRVVISAEASAEAETSTPNSTSTTISSTPRSTHKSTPANSYMPVQLPTPNPTNTAAPPAPDPKLEQKPEQEPALHSLLPCPLPPLLVSSGDNHNHSDDHNHHHDHNHNHNHDHNHNVRPPAPPPPAPTRAILVHCAAGVSRSASLIIAYVMSLRTLSYDEALNLCLSKRPHIRPNPGFVQQLRQYHATLQQRHSLSLSRSHSLTNQPT